MTTDKWKLEVAKGVKLELPGILEFQIDGHGSYIVKSNCLSRRVADYQDNEKRLSEGRPYASGGGGFRRIHKLLHRVGEEGKTITLVARENCAEADLSARKRDWIQRVGNLNKSV
jgi:hypothetical protein